jgi:hypothetical protein
LRIRRYPRIWEGPRPARFAVTQSWKRKKRAKMVQVTLISTETWYIVTTLVSHLANVNADDETGADASGWDIAGIVAE